LLCVGIGDLSFVFLFFFLVVVSWEIFGPIWCCCCELKMPIASIEAGDLNKVWEIRTLGKERDVEARKMLEMAAKQVQPIMRKRKWNVKLLSEFWYAQFFFQLPHNSPLFPLPPTFFFPTSFKSSSHMVQPKNLRVHVELCRETLWVHG
jgi:hypothetical protein